MRAWLWCIPLLAAAIWGLTATVSPPVRMIGVSVWIFVTLKLEAFRLMIERRQTGSMKSSDLLLWLFGTPTLNAESFFNTSGQRIRPVRRDWLRAACSFVAGTILFVVVAPRCTHSSPLLSGWIGVAGLILMLHFGVLNLIALSWQVAGREAGTLMLAPEASCSLSEFWGRRWNTAFRDFSHQTLFRPLTSRYGASVATLAVFVFSGLVHELAISIPARAGYGGSMAYFLLQWLGIVIERKAVRRGWRLRSGMRGWFYAACWILIPAGLLFHRPFMTTVIVPLLPLKSS